MIITIDGPSASGKSTAARSVAQQLHYFYIASGMIYRGLAYALMHSRGYNVDTIRKAREADIAYCLDATRFAYQYDAMAGEHILFEGIDITEQLKTPEVDKAASCIGTDTIARAHILTVIRTLAMHHDIVIDGRDCGTAMFPLADYKFYLTASLLVRAQRYQAMQAHHDKHISLDAALTIVAERDDRDSNRTVAPLKIPEGACIIDSSAITAQEVVSFIVQHVHNKNKEEA